MHEEDRELARRLLAGERRAFDEFFHRYVPRMYRFCGRRINDAEVEDVVMTVMRQGMRRIETYRGEASLFTWLCQIARGEVSRYFKRAALRAKVVSIDDLEEARAELESLPALETPEGAVIGERRRELIQSVLDYLPGDYGSMLEWKYVEGLSVAEIATRLDKPPLAVQSALQRARQAFREAIAGLGNDALELIAPFATAGSADNDRG